MLCNLCTRPFLNQSSSRELRIEWACLITWTDDQKREIRWNAWLLRRWWLFFFFFVGFFTVFRSGGGFFFTLCWWLFLVVGGFGCCSGSGWVVVSVVVAWAISLSRSGPVCIGSFCFFTGFRSNILCGWTHFLVWNKVKKDEMLCFYWWV